MREKMTLSCSELYNSTQNPRVNDITLDLLREYYATYLAPFCYQYEITNSSSEREVIELRFDRENFCHLLGIESIIRYNVGVDQLQNYKGQLGWANVESGVLDFGRLKKLNNRRFKDQKARFVFFYLIPRVLEAPKAVLYDSRLSNSTVDCEVLFYDQFQQAFVHIGIKKDKVLGYYIPKTFLIEKITQQNDGFKYLNNQQAISVIKIVAF